MSFVQTNNSGVGATNYNRAVAFTGAQTAGNLNAIVISFGRVSGTITNVITSVTDTLGNAYAPCNSFLVAAAGSSDSLGQIIYAAPNIKAAGAGANTVTLVCGGASPPDFSTMAIFEHSGLALSSPVDATASAKADNPSATTTPSGSLTTTVANDTLFAAVAMYDGPQSSPSFTGGFTQRAKYYTEHDCDQVGVAIGSYAFQTQSNGTNGWISQLVAFKPAGVAPPTSRPLIMVPN